MSLLNIDIYVLSFGRNWNIVKKQYSFKVIAIKKETLVDSVIPFKIYKDYNEYLS